MDGEEQQLLWSSISQFVDNAINWVFSSFRWQAKVEINYSIQPRCIYCSLASIDQMSLNTCNSQIDHYKLICSTV